MLRVKTNITSGIAGRWASYGTWLLVLYAVARAVVAAHARPLWYDEIFTWAVVHQPGVGQIWNALLRGVDSQGLMFNLIERVAASFTCIEIGFRIPSIIGFACTTVCVYGFVQRRSGAVYGLISAASLMLTVLFLPAAIDARAYSLVVACVAIALVAYQRAAAIRWVAGLALALALAVSFHYYAVFAIVPFAAAEAIYSWQASRVRWPVWVALAVGISPIAVFRLHLSAFRSLFSEGFWAKPSLAAVRESYGIFGSVSSCLGLAAFIACAVGLIWTSWPSESVISAHSIRAFIRFGALRSKPGNSLAATFSMKGLWPSSSWHRHSRFSSPLSSSTAVFLTATCCFLFSDSPWLRASSCRFSDAGRSSSRPFFLSAHWLSRSIPSGFHPRIAFGSFKSLVPH